MKAHLHQSKLIKWGGISLFIVLIALVGLIIHEMEQPAASTAVPTLMVLPQPAADVVEVAQADVPIEDTLPPTHTPTPTEPALPEQPIVQDNAQPPDDQPAVDQPMVDSSVAKQPVDNQIVIRFEPGTTQEQRTAYIQSFGGTVEQEIDALQTVVVRVSAETRDQSLEASPLVAVSEPDYYVTALLDVPTSDVYYADQWALPVIGAPEAWLALPENPQTVTVALVDSGVCLDHPDLAGRIGAGWDYIENDAVPQDEFEHGCGVAGIIAANSDNGLGMAGVAPNAQIMPLRVLDNQGIGTYSDVAAAVVYAVDHGAAIVNLSLGGAFPSSVMENAVNYAASQGVMVIAASGNTGQQSVLYPAAYPAVIAVGSVDRNLQRSSFTSYGPELDLLAPGRDILLTTTSGGYGTNSGTSFAAPQVAGVAALEIAFGQSLVVDGGIASVSNTATVATATPSPTLTPMVDDGQEPSTVVDVVVTKPADAFDVPAGISYQLYKLQVNWLADPQQAASLAVTEPDIEILGDRVKVMFTMQDEASAQAVIDQLPDWDGSLIAHYKKWVDAWIPIEKLTKAAAFPGVSWLQTPIPVYPLEDRTPPAEHVAALSGTYLSQGVAASQADDWQRAGFTGSGVKVGVLDSFAYYTSAQAAGELPAKITKYGTLNTSSPHGTAVAEIIYDMAPGVQLTFASPSSATQMASYIVALAKTHPIISSSMGYYNSEPGDGAGPVSDAIETARTTYGTLYVQAAGNQARYNWNGTFTDSDHDGYHEFSTGVEYNKVGYIPAGYYFPLFLRWNDWPYTDQDYDLYIYYSTDNSNWQYLYGALGIQDGNDPPTEATYVYAATSGYYAFRIYRWSGSDNSIVLDVMGHNANDFYYNHTDHSLVDPATSSYTFGVAALNATAPYTLMSYSSRGPSMGPGGSLATGNDQPRIAGYANVDTWSYGYGVFNGTSSAAPHVAGAAAVVLSAFPSYDADDLADFLEGRAVDMGTSGYDWTYGVGRLDLGAPPPPPNDDFADAEVITALPYTHSLVSTYGATVEAEDPAPSCGYNVGRNVWYRYTPASDDILVLDTSGSGFDSVLSVWTGPHDSLTEVACDDEGGAGSTSYLETVVDAGTTYYIMVGGWNGASGSLVFNAYSVGFSTCATTADITQTECEALEALYNNTNGPGWTDSSNWLFDSRVTNWYGVTVAGGHVTELDLNTNQLDGSIPAQMGNLAYLENLDLNTNQLSGGIPPELGNLANLKWLALWGNPLGGSIPSELGNLSNLELLTLSYTQLTGSIPSELGNLANLQDLWLTGNQLSGSIPYQLGNLTNLQSLYLRNNQLSGSIPYQLGHLPNLEYLYLENNQLTGEVPNALSQLTALRNTDTDIGYNALYASGTTATFLDSKDADWATTQTITPTDMYVVSKTTTSITLGWTAIPYTADNGYYAIGYDTIPGWPFANTVTTADKSATGITLSSLEPGTTYYVMIRTYTPAHGDQQNNVWSELDKWFVLQTAFGPFNAPTSLTSTGASLYQIDLSWTDNSSDESSFSIEQSPNGSDWTEIGYVPANQTTYSRTGLACGTNYSYRVRGFRADDTQYSAYTNTLNTATLACATPEASTIGLYKNGVWQFRNSNDDGPAELRFGFGPAESGWTALVGDWDGDGTDGIGVYKNGGWYLRNSASSGVREISFFFNPLGNGALPIVGDWNRDGIDTIGVYKDGVWILRNSNSKGDPEIIFMFGADGSGWLPIAGDWDGDNQDTVGLYKDHIWYLHNSLTNVDRVRGFAFGPAESGWLPVIGDWDKDGVDTIGLYKNGIWRLRNSNSAGTIDLGFHFIVNQSGWQPVAGYRGGVSGLSALGLGEVWQPEGSVDTPTETPVATEEPVVTEAPVITEEVPLPEATEAVTDTPTEEPVATETPVVTEVPPVTTEAPVVTEEVPPTEVPTEAPLPTEETPSPAPVSETTDEPAA